MSGYVGILEDNVRTFHAQFIDNLGYCLFIAWNGIGTENNSIVWFDGHFFVNAGCHSGEGSHGLSLAARGDQRNLLIRVIPKLVDLNERLVRNLQIPQLRGCADNIYHAPALHSHLPAVFIGRIDDLLHPVHIGGKGRYDDPGILVFRKYIVKGLTHGALRHGKSLTLRIGTVAHECQYAFLSDLRKPLQVNGISKYRCIVHLKVACVHHDPCR